MMTREISIFSWDTRKLEQEFLGGLPRNAAGLFLSFVTAGMLGEKHWWGVVVAQDTQQAGNARLWGDWQHSKEEAMHAYMTMTPEKAKPRSEGGRLSFWEDTFILHTNSKLCNHGYVGARQQRLVQLPERSDWWDVWAFDPTQGEGYVI